VLFRAIGRSQKYGLPPIWMNQVGRGGGTAKGPLHRMARQVCGWCWMFDAGAELHSVSRGRPQQWQRVHWGIAAGDVQYHGYWKQTLVQDADDDIIVSVWTRPGTALLQVFNLARSPKTARLTIDAKALRLKSAAEVYDLESGAAFAALGQQLRRFDAGQVQDAAEVRRIQDACRSVGAEPYRLKDLKAIGNSQRAQITVPPRDFVLLVVE
jgi:hypothetical protein